MEEHEILPDTASVTREGTMLPATITEALDYPLEAACSQCGRPVRCPVIISEWSHAEITATARRMAFQAAHPHVHFDYDPAERDHTATWPDSTGRYREARRRSLHDLVDALDRDPRCEPRTLPAHL